MSTHYLQLLLLPRTALAKTPTAYIAIKNSQPLHYTMNDKIVEERIISPDLVTFGELEIHINSLIDELHKIKAEGKKFFERQMRRVVKK
ncbi:MAG: hypothetical protein ACLP7A_10820 [Desulfobaccales bacterium]